MVIIVMIRIHNMSHIVIIYIYIYISDLSLSLSTYIYIYIYAYIERDVLVKCITPLCESRFWTHAATRSHVLACCKLARGEACRAGRRPARGRDGKHGDRGDSVGPV